MSAHFTLSELHGDNAPDSARSNLLRLMDLLEECRSVWKDHAVHVTSGYRSPTANEAANGSKGSQHLAGEAADLHVEGIDAYTAWLLLRLSKIQVGQAIVYGMQPGCKGHGTFLHVSLPNHARGLVNDFLWTEAAGGSGGPYHRVER